MKSKKEIRREYYNRNREACIARTEAWRLQNPDKVREYDIKCYNRRLDVLFRRKYGITHLDYQKMNSSQGGVCAICKKTCTCGRSLAVDHDHKTGKVRALLCSRCNRGLGLFMESTEYLKSAQDYLEKHDQPNISP